MENFVGKESGLIEAFIQVDPVEVERKLGDLSHKANLVMSRASNRTITNVTKNMKSEVKKKYRIKSSDIGKTITTKRASVNQPFASVISTDRHPNLAKFKVSPNRPVKVLKSKKRSPKAYRAAVERTNSGIYLTGENKPFIATMQNGFTGLFQRKSVKSRRLKGVYGPAVPQMLKNDAVMRVINQEASEMMMKRVEAEIKHLFG